MHTYRQHYRQADIHTGHKYIQAYMHTGVNMQMQNHIGAYMHTYVHTYMQLHTRKHRQGIHTYIQAGIHTTRQKYMQSVGHTHIYRGRQSHIHAYSLHGIHSGSEPKGQAVIRTGIHTYIHTHINTYIQAMGTGGYSGRHYTHIGNAYIHT